MKTAFCIAMLVSVTASLWQAAPVRAQHAAAFRRDVGASTPNNADQYLSSVKVEEHLEATLPLDAPFFDHTGQRVQLGRYFTGRRPVVLNLVYHSCPTLCSMVLAATIDSLKEQDWTVGREFDVVTISFDPNDTPELAAQKRAETLTKYGRPGAETGWHFLVGDQFSIDRVTEAVGFRYFYDQRAQQFAHPAVSILATGDGRIARYLHGLEIPRLDMRLGLFEASEGRSMTTADHILLYCYTYDPNASQYVLMATNVMKLGGLLTMLLLGAFLGSFWIRELRRKRTDDPQDLPLHEAVRDSAHPSAR